MSNLDDIRRAKYVFKLLNFPRGLHISARQHQEKEGHFYVLEQVLYKYEQFLRSQIYMDVELRTYSWLWE